MSCPLCFPAIWLFGWLKFIQPKSKDLFNRKILSSLKYALDNSQMVFQDFKNRSKGTIGNPKTDAYNPWKPPF